MASKVPPKDLDVVFASGADSSRDPRLPAGFYARGWNVVNRGGVIRTRPGLTFRFNLPPGRLQGSAVFIPRRGANQIVSVVDGYIYVAEAPFMFIRQIPGVRMDPSARSVHICMTEQALKRNEDYSLTLLPVPRRVMFFQDGLSAATWYDGTVAGTITGPVDGTPMGTAMAWSGQRLWVARGNQVFASDIANPFSFVEGFYLGGTDSFFTPQNVVAMREIEGTGDPQLLVFTQTATVSVQSNILTRELWTTTPNFIRTLFPNVGCVSHRSIVSQFGGMWWYSQYGLISFDLAAATHLSSVFPITDLEMGDSKRHTYTAEGVVAGVSYENMLLMSVPYGHKYNAHTWVLDQTAYRTLTTGGNPAWSGVWHGFQPVEWMHFPDDGNERVFAAITDGENNQVVELDPKNTQDSGVDIECGVELRVLTHGVPDIHEFKFAEIFFSDIRGSFDLRADWRGLDRGPYAQCLTKRIEAGIGSISHDDYISFDKRIFATRPQSRRVFTLDIREAIRQAGAQCGVEGTKREGWDYGFQLLVRWSGTGTFRELKLSATYEADANAGKCEVDELAATTGVIRFDGLEGATMEDLDAPTAMFYATETYSGTAHGDTREATASATSAISDAAAEKQALQEAAQQVALILWAEGPPSLSSE